MRDLLFDLRILLACKRAISFKGKIFINMNVGVLYDELFGRRGILPSKTNRAIPSWVISNKGFTSLRHVGYIICNECGGDGWDANSGGALFICPSCNGAGVRKALERCVNCGHTDADHYPYVGRTCLHNVTNGEDYKNGYPCKCQNYISRDSQGDNEDNDVGLPSM